MKINQWLIPILFSLTTTTWGQLHTYDYRKANPTTPFEETVSIDAAYYKHLLLFKPATATVKLINVPTGVSVKTNESWYSASNSGTEWTISFNTADFLNQYSKGKPLLLLGLDGNNVVGTIQYTLGAAAVNNTTKRPLTPGSFGNTIVLLDMCPESTQPLTVWSNGKARKWLYVSNREAVTFQVRNISPNSYSVAVNGDFPTILADSEGGEIFADLFKKSSDGAPGGGAVEPAVMTTFTTKSDAEKALEIQSTIDDLKTREAKIKPLNELLKKRLDQVSQSCSKPEFTPESFSEEVKNTLGGIPPKSVEDYKSDVTQYIKNLEKYLGPGGLPNNHPNYQSFTSELTRFRTVYTSTFFDGIENQIKKIRIGLENRSVSSLPITVNGKNSDVVRFTVDKVYLNPTSKQTASYDIFISGGVKVDVSAGIFMNWLVDDTYVGREVSPATTSTSSTTAPTRYVPVKEESGNVSFGAGALLHVYPRWNLLQGMLNFGLSVGVSAGSKVNYYGGVSALLGRQERIVLTGGKAFGSVKRLSLVYEDTAEAKANGYAVTGGKFATRDVIENAWFVSVTYNLGSKTPNVANEK